MKTWYFRNCSRGPRCALTAQGAMAQDACTNRGQLDDLYCDADNDLVADVPNDPAK